MRKLRYMIAFCLSFVTSLVGSFAQPCSALDEESHEALEVLVAQYHPLQEGVGHCGLTTKYAAEAIIQQGPAIMPCLRHIYHHGLRGTKFWPLDTPAPTDRSWILPLISRIDSQMGTKLYEAQYAALEQDPIRRARVAIALANLGQREYLARLTDLLTEPPVVSQASNSELQGLMAQAVETIAKHQYEPALGTLQRLVQQGWTRNRRLPVFVAQLARDADSLRQYAPISGLSGAALRALAAIGRTDILEELASDPHYLFKKAAREVLERAEAQAVDQAAVD